MARSQSGILALSLLIGALWQLAGVAFVTPRVPSTVSRGQQSFIVRYGAENSVPTGLVWPSPEAEELLKEVDGIKMYPTHAWTDEMVPITEPKKKLTNDPVIIGVAADSGCGKSTFLRRILGALGTDVVPGHTAIGEMMTVVCLDDYHTNDRAGRAATGLTALDAAENDFALMGAQMEALKEGKAVYKPIYNHDTGNKDPPELIEPNKVMVFEGLHPIYDEKARSVLDLAIYIDIVNDVKFAWKVQRDVAERGWTEDQVKADIEKRLPDFSAYVDPQKANADVILRYEPSDKGLPFLKVKLIQKKGGAFPAISLKKDITLEGSEPGAVLKMYDDEWFGNDVTVIEMDGEIDMDKMEAQLKEIEENMEGLSADAGELTDAMVKLKKSPGSENGTGLLQTVIAMKVREIYEKMTGEDRRMTFNEFKMCLTLCNCQVSDSEAQMDFRKCDKNGGGVILFDEFCHYFASKICPQACEAFPQGGVVGMAEVHGLPPSLHYETQLDELFEPLWLQLKGITRSSGHGESYDEAVPLTDSKQLKIARKVKKVQARLEQRAWVPNRLGKPFSRSRPRWTDSKWRPSRSVASGSTDWGMESCHNDSYFALMSSASISPPDEPATFLRPISSDAQRVGTSPARLTPSTLPIVRPATHPTKRRPRCSALGDGDGGGHEAVRASTATAAVPSRPTGRKTTTAIKLKETRPDTTLEVMLHTIKRVVCGMSDEAIANANEHIGARTAARTLRMDASTSLRELALSERDRISGIFREIALSALQGKREKDVVWSKVTVTLPELLRWLRPLLGNAHAQRVVSYFEFPKKIRQNTFTDHVAPLVCAGIEERLKICFAILDLDGDSSLGPRDVFAALTASRPSKDRPATKVRAAMVSAEFINLGPLGFLLGENDNTANPWEVVDVYEGSTAQLQGVEPGHCLTHINAMEIAPLPRHDVLRRLRERPLRLQFRDLEPARSVDGQRLLETSTGEFDRLMRALPTRKRFHLLVSILGCQGLRAADEGVGGNSDPYCMCEVSGKPLTRVKTKVIHDCQKPQWNEIHQISDYQEGDTLRFSVSDYDVGSKDDLLGTVTVSSSRFDPHPFDGELKLRDPLKGSQPLLRVKILVCEGGGIGFSEFTGLFNRELAFFSRLEETLTGITPKISETSRAGLPLSVDFVSAAGLRNADARGMSDPYGTCEVVGKPKTRVKTKVLNDTLNPVWKQTLQVPDYSAGDSLKFMVFDHDIGVSSQDELLGQVVLSSSHFTSGTFSGDLVLIDGTDQAEGPTLRVRVRVQWPQVKRPEQGISTGNFRRTTGWKSDALYKHEEEIKELRKNPGLTEEDSTWYIQTFAHFCEEDHFIRSQSLAVIADKMFTLPSTLLAGRLFQILDGDGSGCVGLRKWYMLMAKLRQGTPDQRVGIAFKLYDILDNGRLSIEEALSLSLEVQHLTSSIAPKQALPRPAQLLCEEMQALYGKVAESVHGLDEGLPFRRKAREAEVEDDPGLCPLGQAKPNVLIDQWWFKQRFPRPMVIEVLLQNLNAAAAQR